MVNVICRWRTVASLSVMLSIAAGLSAQTPAFQTSAQSPDVLLKQGWNLLDQQDLTGASAVARALIDKFPKNPLVEALVVEVTIATSGPIAGLGSYEGWLGSGNDEDRDVFRRVARGFLRAAAADKTRITPRVEALDALLTDGDPAAAGLMDVEAPSKLLPETPLLAARGDERATRLLIELLQNPLANRPLAIGGLARSHSALAVKPLISLLTDMDTGLRVAAIDALGQLGFSEAISSLKPLLTDQVFDVRLAAASALLQLHDLSGLPWLRELEQSEYPGTRLTAANATKSAADPAWVENVRRLTRDPDVNIRRRAAQLLAPHDPDTARDVLKAVLADDNPAEREAAGQAYVLVATDPVVLRTYLKSTDRLLRVRAAARILEQLR